LLSKTLSILLIAAHLRVTEIVQSDKPKHGWVHTIDLLLNPLGPEGSNGV